MKLFYSLFFAVFLLSCSQEEQPPQDYEQFMGAIIKSYSVNYGHSGQEVTMYGEHFTTDLSKITLKFDDITANVISASLTEIKFTLPTATRPIPELNLHILNKTVTKSVVNDYQGNIGILPAINYNNWTVLNQSLVASTNLKINKIQQISASKIYLNIHSGIGGTLLYSGDSGISWKVIDDCWSDLSAFHMTNSGSGLCSTGVGLRKISNLNPVTTGFVKEIPFISAVYMDENLTNATFVTNKGLVYSSTDGVNYDIVYSSTNSSNSFYDPFYYPVNDKLSNNHIWVGGINGENVSGSKKYPFILFKNNTTDGWKEFPFQNDLDFRPSDLIFINETTGYFHSYSFDSNLNRVSSKIYKTITGGDSWTSVFNGQPFLHITFKDQNTGWAIYQNKIYKTINGGTTWQLDYTHTQDLRNISYKDGVVWSFSKDHILKLYIQ